MERKGQAAMEFLMTYGWAILAAIIVIGVLAIYFRPSTLATESFIVTAPFYGVGSTISASQIQLEIRNNGGETLATSAATLTFNNPSGAICGTGSGFGSLNTGASQVLAFACTAGLTAGDTVSADVTISYTRPGSTLTLTSTGSLSGRV